MQFALATTLGSRPTTPVLRIESNADAAADTGRIAVSNVEYSDNPALRYEEDMA